jgi:hypothetical protein
MNKFINRLKYYSIGFGIGLIFVFFFFQNRGCSWLPDNRVKNTILDRVLVLSELESEKIKKAGISDNDIIQLLNDGDVQFKKSIKDSDFKVYLIQNEKHKMYFTLPKESFISEIKMANVSASKIKTSQEGTGRFLRFPNDESLIYVDSMPILGCQLQAIGMINQKLILKSLKKNGTIDFAESKLEIQPKPEHTLYFEDTKKNKIAAKVIWYKNKLTIQQFTLPFETNCSN